MKSLAVCGIDEAGRGPLAGPVVAACVFIPPEYRRKSFWRQVTDSKKLARDKRETLFDKIREHAKFGIAEASVEEIDQLNIHHATLLAMRRAFEAMKAEIADLHALVDGKFVPPGLPCKATAVVDGDALHLPISAASILAKVTRDRLMRRLHEEHPHYGWHTNVGYSTEEHMQAIRLYGITIHHRRSFEPCQQLPLL